MKLANTMIGLVFLVDILVNFRTTYIDKSTGEEVLYPGMIAKNYMMSLKFQIDVLSSIPFENMTSTKYKTLLNLLVIVKVLRIQRINNLILKMNTSKETNAGYKVGYMVFLMFMYIHVAGCAWYSFVSDQEAWIPN